MKIKLKRLAAVMSVCALASGFITCGIPINEKQTVTVTAAEKNTVAKSGKCGTGLNWNFSGDTGTLTISGKGEMDNYWYYGGTIANPPVNSPWYEIRDLIKKLVITGRVTSIGSHAFEELKNLESAVLPGSIIAIGEYAFQNCRKLREVNIPKGIEKIEEYTFESCESIEKVTVFGNVKAIGMHAFENCTGLSELVLEEGINRIYHSAFSSCRSLTSVDIPASVENFTYAFSGCDNMQAINVSEDNAFWTSIDGIVFSKDMTKLWEYPNGKKDSTYTIPEGVKFIGCSALPRGEHLRDIKLPKSVTYLTGGVFSNMLGFKNVTVPENIMSIGESSFYECNNLETITILNPKCDIYDDINTISNCRVKVGEYGSKPSFNGTIIGYEGSTAQAYAEKYDYKFKSLGKYKDSGALGLEIYNFTADFLTGALQPLNRETLDEMDVNSDGKVNIFDLIIMKRELK